MKISTFEQEWVVTGNIKSVTGRIVVTMNHDTKKVEGTHAGTHDDYVKYVLLHKIEGFIADKVWWTESNLDSELMVLNEVERCKKQMQEEMARLSNEQPLKSFSDKMMALGFGKK